MALLRLDEFDEKAEEKGEDEEEADEPPFPAQEGGPFTQAPKKKEENEVPDRLIELGGMARHGKTPVGGVAKEDRPWKVGGGSHDFLVEKVADPDEGAGERRWHRDEIEEANPGQVRVFFADSVAEQDDGQNDPDDGSVAREASVSQFKKLERVGQIIGRALVEEEVAEARAEDRADDDIDREAVRDLFDLARLQMRVAGKNFDENEEGKPKTEGKKDAVP